MKRRNAAELVEDHWLVSEVGITDRLGNVSMREGSPRLANTGTRAAVSHKELTA